MALPIAIFAFLIVPQVPLPLAEPRRDEFIRSPGRLKRYFFCEERGAACRVLPEVLGSPPEWGASLRGWQASSGGDIFRLMIVAAKRRVERLPAILHEVKGAFVMDLYQFIAASVSPLLARSRRLTRELNLYNGELAWLRKSYFVPLSQYYSLGTLNKLEMQKSIAIMAQLMEEATQQGVAAHQELDELLQQVAKIQALTHAVLANRSDAALQLSADQVSSVQREDVTRLLAVLMLAVEEQKIANETLGERLSDCSQILSRLQSEKGLETPSKGAINEMGRSLASRDAIPAALAFCR